MYFTTKENSEFIFYKICSAGSGSAFILPSGSGSAFRKTAGSVSAQNECGSTALLLLKLSSLPIDLVHENNFVKKNR